MQPTSLTHGVLVEGSLGAVFANKTRGQLQQIIDPHAQQHLAGAVNPGLGVLTDKAAGLPMLQHPGATEQREDDKDQEVTHQRHHTGQRQRINTPAGGRRAHRLNNWQLIGVPMQPRPHQRQDQQVQPQHDPDQQARQHAGAVGLFPEQGAEHGRGELADCSKGHLTDTRQAGLAADQAVDHVGQQQDDQNTGAPHVQQPATETLVGVLGAYAVAQQYRQYHIVGDHGAQRNGRHNYHARGGGSPAQKRRHGEGRVALHQRQADHVGIR